MIDVGNLRRAASMLDRRLRWRWAGLVVMSVFAAALEAVGALGIFWLIGMIHDPLTATSLPIVGPIAAWAGIDGGRDWLIAGAVGVMVFYAAKNAFLILHYYLQVRMPQDAYVQVSSALLRGYLSADYEFHFHRNSAEIIRNLTNSVDIVFRTVLHNAVTLISEALVVCAMLAVVVVTMSLEGLVAAGVLAAVSWGIFRLSQNRVTAWGLQVQDLARKLLKVIQQSLGAIKEVRVMQREEHFLAEYLRLRSRQSRLMAYYETVQNIPLLSLEALFALLLGGLVLMMTLRGSELASAIPILALYGYVGIRLLPSLARIAAKLQRLGFGAAAVDQVYADYARLCRARGARDDPGKDLAFAREILFEDVAYSYPGSARRALDGLSMRIPRGKSFGIVGASGGGKSTAMDILLGLLRPSSGRVTVDGVDIADATRAWQRNLGYVPQSAYLLDDTLRRNIAFGVADERIDDAAVAEAVRMAQLDPLVATLPQGLDTEIGERGVRLSGGQRQRIVIARALYRRPAVLVFDEATSELDNRTEVEIGAAIGSLAGERTVIVVAHRMATVQHCDAVAFLVDGRVADCGRFEELLSRNAAFRRLALAGAGEAVADDGGSRLAAG
jgi:ATP-binding cassette, subfamily B, bacterial PglK